MRKTLLCAIAFALGATAAYSQAYVSVSGGYGFQAHTKVLGRDASNPTKRSCAEDTSSTNVGEVN